DAHRRGRGLGPGATPPRGSRSRHGGAGCRRVGRRDLSSRFDAARRLGPQGARPAPLARGRDGDRCRLRDWAADRRAPRTPAPGASRGAGQFRDHARYSA
ncbi:MAG: hypothetical protein AVDCRST_MAG88-2497, partial [uncultured Thermomicrobiales bacterium]